MNIQENQPNALINQPQQPRFTRRRIILFSVVVIVLLTACGLLIAKHISKPSAVSDTKQLVKTPAKIGSYRYVNACQAVPEKSYKQVFGYDMTNNTYIENTYADGNHSKLAKLTSECLTSFGDKKVDIGGGNTAPSSVATMRSTLSEYSDPKLAAAEVSGLGSQQGQDVDLSALGIDDSITTSAFETIDVDGIKVYNNLTRNGRFYFAYRNISAGFSVADLDSTDESAAPITPDYIKTLIKNLVPVMKSSIDNTQLPQSPLEIQNLGERLVGGSSAKIIAPCDYFTGADFRTVTGSDGDSSLVNATYDTNPIAQAKRADPNKQNLSGLGDISCQRKGYIDTVQPSIQSYPDFKEFAPADLKYKNIEYPVITETVRYFKNKDDAVAGAKSLLSSHTKSYPDTKNSEVTGMGNFAAFSEFTISSDIVDTSTSAGAPKEYYFYVAKDSYVVSIQMFYTSGNVNVIRNGSDTQMKRAAQLLIDRLPN